MSELVISEVCVWAEDDCGMYETTCNNSFQFNDGGGPVDNLFKFCAYCGKPIKEILYFEEDSDD